MKTYLGPTAFLPILLAVESRLAHTDDLLRRAVHPPVDQVKVVTGFVDHQTAGVVLGSVPSLLKQHDSLRSRHKSDRELSAYPEV